MFIAQVYCTTIGITWRIIGFTCLLISTVNLVLRFFFINDNILFYTFSWVVWYLNTIFPLIKVSGIFFLLIFPGIRSLSGDTAVILSPALDILERLGLSLLAFIYFGCSMLILLSDKLAYEIDLDVFSVFIMSYVSVILEALYLYNDLGLSNYIPLFDSFLIDLSFFLFYACGLSVYFMASIIYFPCDG